MEYNTIINLNEILAGEITGNEYLLITNSDDSYKMKFSNFVTTFESQVQIYFEDFETLVDAKLDKTHDMALTIEGDVTGSGTFHNMNDAVLSVTTADNIAKLDVEQIWTEKQSFSNNINLTFGDAEELKVQFDGGNSVFDHTGSGSLMFKSDQTLFRNFLGQNQAIFNADGSVIFYHNGNIKLQTTVDGISVLGKVESTSLDITQDAVINGDLYLNEKIISSGINFQGMGAEYTIELSDASELNLGTIKGDAASFGFYDDSVNEWLLQCEKSGGVTLYHGANQKLSTTLTGINIDGEVQCELLNVDGRIDVNDGWNSVFVGDGAGASVEDINNFAVALGINAGFSNESGLNWVAIGHNSGTLNADGNDWTAIGKSAGSNNISGDDWTAIGSAAGVFNTIGSNWTAIGSKAGLSNSTGNNWVALGKDAGSANTIGNDWTALGYKSGSKNISGNNWIAIGSGAAEENTNGENWTAIGKDAGHYLADGIELATDFNNSVYLGGDTKVSALGVSNEIVIGYNAIGKGSNTIKLGNDLIENVSTNGDIEILNDEKGLILIDQDDNVTRWRISIQSGRLVTSSL